MIPIQHGFQPEQLNPVTLAFLGDAVYELLVRTYVVQRGSMSAGKLHQEAICFVSAKHQARAMDALLPMLEEDEKAVYQRGRNANHVKPPKNADPMEYRIATGMEALIGYLYLQEKYDRIYALFDAVIRESDCGGHTI